MERIFSSERMRLVLGASRRAVELEGVDEEWYRGMLMKTAREELLRNEIIQQLKGGEMSAVEIAERIGKSPKEIFWNLIAMKRRGMVFDAGVKDGSLKFTIEEGI